MLLLLVALSLPISVFAAEGNKLEVIESAKLDFEVLDQYAQSPEVNDILILELSVTNISNVILTELAELESNLNTLLISADEGDVLYTITNNQLTVARNTANRTKNIANDINEYINTYGSELSSKDLYLFRDKLIDLKFIFVDVMGTNGHHRDKLYQELRTEFDQE